MNDQLLALRRDLHAHPELSGNEKETIKRIKTFVHKQTGLEGTDVGGYGSCYTFNYGKGNHLLVRVDIDGLPIQEVNDFEYVSKTKGVSHKCGHDGHAAIGAGLVIKLHNEPLKHGKLTVLFQPAEEIGEGAKSVLNDPSFDISAFDHAVALHNIPGKTMHQIIYKKDSFTPAVQSLIIKLFGKTSHAAEPLKGTNPSYAISEIIEYAKNNEQTGEDHPEYRLITPVFVTVGSKDYGISAGYGEIHFTIRSWEQNTMEKATESTLEFVKKQCDKYGLKLETEITASFASNKNDHEVVNHIAEASKTLDLEAFEKPKPFPWGEDFGLFTQHVSGAMFGLGAGENTPALHNPDYDFPDEITPTGINMFYQIAKNICEDV